MKPPRATGSRRPPPVAKRGAGHAARAAALAPWLVRRGGAIAWGLAAAWTIVFSFLSLRKLGWYLYRDFDLAIFAQAARGILSGSLDSSIRGMAWLGDHSSLVLFPIAPLTLLAPATIVLLVIQSAALGSVAVAVHRIARRELGSEAGALAFALAALLQPALGHLNLFEFHPETIATAALLWAWDSMRAGHAGRTAAWAALALACKEDVAPVVLVVAGVAWWMQRPAGGRFAWRLAALAVLSAALTFLVLKPAFDPGVVDYARMYGEWGATRGEQLRGMLAHPLGVLQHLAGTPGDPQDTVRKQDLLFQLLAPFGFLPLLAPLALLPALPALAAHFLSDRMEQHVIVFQYTALLVPFVTIAAVHGVARLARWLARGRGGPAAALLALGVLASAAACQRTWGALSADGIPRELQAGHRVRVSDVDRALKPYRDRMVAAIGRRDGIVAGFELLNRFSSRRRVHSAHHVLSGVYTYSDRPYPVPHDIEAAVLDAGSGELVRILDMDSARRWAELVRVNRLRPVDAVGDLTLWIRDARDTFALLTPDPMRPPGRPIPLGGEIVWLGAEVGTLRRGLLPIETWWQRIGPVPGLVQMDLALLDATGRPVVGRSRMLGYGLMPPATWPLGEGLRERYLMLVPAMTPPGQYQLAMRLLSREGGSGRPLEPPDGGRNGWIGLGGVRIEAPVTGRAAP